MKIENLEQETYFNITFDKSSYKRSALLLVHIGRGVLKSQTNMFPYSET